MQRVLARSAIPGNWPQTQRVPAALAGRALPFILSVISGSTDIIGFLGLNGLFTAHVTGNIVIIAAHLIAGERATFSAILAVPVFMLVVFLARLLAGGIERARASVLAPLLLVQLLSLAGFLAVGAAAGPQTDADSVLAVIAGMLGVAAMAVQNVLVQIALRDTPATAQMTTNIAHFMVDIAEILVGRDAAAMANADRRARRTLPVLLGFALGCGLGAALEASAGLWSLTLPVGLALIALAIGLAQERRP
jgi:uncharacterized membrane protein YoaK (UPF0700 family)